MHLDNAWYVAAWDHDVSRGPSARMLLGPSVDPNADNPTLQARNLLAIMIDAKPRANDTRRRAP